MRVTFYGTRGSIAVPGESTLRYGGNTSCIEIVSDSGTQLIIDAGTGAVALGRRIAAAAKPVHSHLLISHTHWDHIQGIPFFGPLFIPGYTWDIYGPRGLGQSLSQTLAGQMEYTYFPVAMDQMGATIHYHDLVEGTLTIGDIAITCHNLNHPALTLGYRLEVDGAVVVYSCDHEPHAIALAGGDGEITGPDLRHSEFLAGADLVIHDAQYLPSEYGSKRGWGHSTPHYAFAVARQAGVRRLALSHHDPSRDDAEIDAIVRELKARAVAQGGPDVFAAAEGQTIEVNGRLSAAEAAGSAAGQAVSALAGRSALLALADEKLQAELEAIAAEDEITVFTAGPADVAAVADRERPSVILIGGQEEDALAACRAIRALGDYGAEVTVVLVTHDGGARETDAPFSDRLVLGYTAAYVKTRLRAWLMRVIPRWAPAPLPEDEAARLAATRALRMLDTPREERFDRITRLAASMFDVPVALISLMDEERQWFKSACGIDAAETSRDSAFCSYVIYNHAPLVVTDALADDRFAENPLVQGPPRVRFYAGYPLVLDDGAHVGTICLVDSRPHDVDDAGLARLRDLAALTVRELKRGADGSV